MCVEGCSLPYNPKRYSSDADFKLYKKMMLVAISLEFNEAIQKFETFHSTHEGYAIIKEEVEELWDEIKKKVGERDPNKIQKEAIQVGAMALRFLVDLC
jgi:hypothetical protein